MAQERPDVRAGPFTEPKDRIEMEYRKYLQSTQWMIRRERRLKLAGCRCEYEIEQRPWDMKHSWTKRCDATDKLEVHHLHYNTLGYEADDDLEVLCRFHHLLSHMLCMECEISGEEVYPNEQDATDVLEAAARFYGGVEMWS
jgi:hypothetical protein